jgi:hypothetical protein
MPAAQARGAVALSFSLTVQREFERSSNDSRILGDHHGDAILAGDRIGLLLALARVPPH